MPFMLAKAKLHVLLAGLMAIILPLCLSSTHTFGIRNYALAQTEHDLTQESVKTWEVGVFKPQIPTNYEIGASINIISLVEHVGIPYCIVSPDFTYEELSQYKTLIFPSFGTSYISTDQELAITQAIDTGVSVIWVGSSISNLPLLQTALGIKYVADGHPDEVSISNVLFEETAVPVYWDENLKLVNTE